MLGDLGFAPWQYGLAFAVPCAGGLVGSRLARTLVARFREHRVLVASGVLRVCWPVGLAFVGPGTSGLVLVMVVEFGLITSIGVFNPVYATRRLELTPTDRVARTLSAWTVSGKLATAGLDRGVGPVGEPDRNAVPSRSRAYCSSRPRCCCRGRIDVSGQALVGATGDR